MNSREVSRIYSMIEGTYRSVINWGDMDHGYDETLIVFDDVDQLVWHVYVDTFEIGVVRYGDLGNGLVYEDYVYRDFVTYGHLLADARVIYLMDSDYDFVVPAIRDRVDMDVVVESNYGGELYTVSDLKRMGARRLRRS